MTCLQCYEQIHFGEKTYVYKNCGFMLAIDTIKVSEMTDTACVQTACKNSQL